MDEIDAIGKVTIWYAKQLLLSYSEFLFSILPYAGGRRFSEGTSADREIQRTLMEVGHRTNNIIS